MRKLIFIVLASQILLVGCASRSAPVSDSRAGTIKKEQVAEVQTGRVTAVKKVVVLGQRSGTGNTIGRTIGAIAGGAIGSGYGSVAGSILGSMMGGAAGSSADKELQRKDGLEITVRLDSGQHITVTQLADVAFKSGDKVKLMMKNGAAQVTHRK